MKAIAIRLEAIASNKKLLVTKGIATSNKKLLEALGRTTRSKDATIGAPGIATTSILATSNKRLFSATRLARGHALRGA